MTTPPNLLNDDGTASIATAFMSSHHAFRRDLGRFARALERLAADPTRAEPLRDEWAHFRQALHGHHEVEDANLFPNLRAQGGRMAETIDRLSADHRQIDPLLELGDRAFGELPGTLRDATAVVAELRALLDVHLALEESEIIPGLRAVRGFPPPGSDAEADLYAAGFAWSTHGIAADVVAALDAILPDNVRARLAAARTAYGARCERAFGKVTVGDARTPIPTGT